MVRFVVKVGEVIGDRKAQVTFKRSPVLILDREIGDRCICLREKGDRFAYRYDDQDKLRVIADPVTFADVTDAAFNQIRQYGQTSVAVTIRLLEAIAVIAPFTHTKADRAALLRHANTIKRGSEEGITEELDRNDVKERYLAAVKASLI
jgi:uncharacterized membrane protein